MVTVTPAHPLYEHQKAQEAAAQEPVVPMFVPHAETTKYAVGLDLGQAQDFTAISVLQSQCGMLDAGTAYERHTGLSRHKRTPGMRIDVRHLERIKLNTSYPEIVAHVCELMLRPPLCGHDDIPPARLVVDDTGCGRPVSDLLVDAGLDPLRITITAGTEITWPGRDRRTFLRAS